MDEIDANSASDRSEVVCPECWTEGAEPYEVLIDQYHSDKARITGASKCPNEECSVDRIPPGEVQRQLDTNSEGIELLGRVFRKATVGMVAVAIVFFAFVVMPLIANGAILGGGTALPGDDVSGGDETVSGFYLKSVDNGTVVTNGVQYINQDGEISPHPVYFDDVGTAERVLLNVTNGS